MNQDYDLHLKEAKGKIEESSDLETLKKVEVELLGKQSLTAQAKGSLGELEPEERRELGLILMRPAQNLRKCLRQEEKSLAQS